MTDHHDFGDHHDYHQHDDYYPEHAHHDDPLNDEPPAYDDHGHDDPAHLAAGHHPAEHYPEPTHEPAPTTHDLHIVDDQPAPHETAPTDGYDDPADVFPPPVDVGDLPQPVDGFPWIDPTALGTPDLTGHHSALPAVPAHELAEYAATELPEGTDPWTALAASDDPATNTLARFWHDTTD